MGSKQPSGDSIRKFIDKCITALLAQVVRPSASVITRRGIEWESCRVHGYTVLLMKLLEKRIQFKEEDERGCQEWTLLVDPVTFQPAIISADDDKGAGEFILLCPQLDCWQPAEHWLRGGITVCSGHIGRFGKTFVDNRVQEFKHTATLAVYRGIQKLTCCSTDDLLNKTDAPWNAFCAHLRATAARKGGGKRMRLLGFGCPPLGNVRVRVSMPDSEKNLFRISNTEDGKKRCATPYCLFRVFGVSSKSPTCKRCKSNFVRCSSGNKEEEAVTARIATHDANKGEDDDDEWVDVDDDGEENNDDLVPDGAYYHTFLLKTMFAGLDGPY